MKEMLNNLIVAFDGNVFTGKTSLIEFLCYKYKFNIIPEYSFFVDNIQYIELYKNLKMNEQLVYIKVDELRKKEIKDGFNILDRSFVSMSAHVYALFKIGLLDIRSEYLKAIEMYLKNDKIIIPDLYVYVKLDYSLAKSRFLNDKVKFTQAIYINKEYFDAINLFGEFWIDCVNGFLIDNTINTTEENVDNLFLQLQNYQKNNLKCNRIIDLISEILFNTIK